VNGENGQTRWPWEAGLGWAFAMLALQLGEALVLCEVVFSDRPASGLEGGRGSLLPVYFAIVVLTALLQMLGIALVIRGHNRLGGVLQIISSAPHALKIEGLVGIIGGSKAWQHQAPRASGP